MTGAILLNSSILKQVVQVEQPVGCSKLPILNSPIPCSLHIVCPTLFWERPVIIFTQLQA